MRGRVSDCEETKKLIERVKRESAAALAMAEVYGLAPHANRVANETGNLVAVPAKVRGRGRLSRQRTHFLADASMSRSWGT
ncbi:hypothetical protein D7S89_16395 [Trinickia fusca]|uniref:Uncharacterized protein n=1 Tax=Trinickia fusca TaxID=2419777 RepID=A0A494X883_9BURK|nr:hypothetical protein D7S89_16395 [Trinickia fusca]